LGSIDEVIETFGSDVLDQETPVLRVVMGEQPMGRGGTKGKKKSKGKRRG
jgi:hypothetical protein